MSIFDIFTFKRDLEAVATEKNYNGLVDLIKNEIIKQIKNNIPGEEKMNAVIETAIIYVDTKIHSNNKLVQWVIDNILLKGLRNFAQNIYNTLKEKVKDL